MVAEDLGQNYHLLIFLPQIQTLCLSAGWHLLKSRAQLNFGKVLGDWVTFLGKDLTNERSNQIQYSICTRIRQALQRVRQFVYLQRHGSESHIHKFGLYLNTD